MSNYVFWGPTIDLSVNSSSYVFINAFGEFMGMFIFIFVLISSILNVKLKASHFYSAKNGFFSIVLGISIGLLMGCLVSCGIEQGILKSIASQQEYVKNYSYTLNPIFVIASMLKGANFKEASSYIPIGNGFVIIIAQFVGALLAAFLAHLTFRTLIKKQDDLDYVSKCFYTSPAINNYWQNSFCEFIATFIFSIVIFATSFLIKNDYIIILFVSIFLVGIGYSFGGLTGYSLNPWRDFCPRLATYILYKDKINWKYTSISFTSPLIGCILALLIMPGFLY